MGLVDRSDFLKLAVANVEDDAGPVPLVLPRDIDSECIDSWLVLNDDVAVAPQLEIHQVERSSPARLLQAMRVRISCSSCTGVCSSLHSVSEGF